MRLIVFLILITFGILDPTTISVKAEANHNDENILGIVKETIPTDSVLISPENLNSTKPYQLHDFNNDGHKEIIINYKLIAKKQPNPSKFGAIILKKENDKWTKIWETKAQAVGLEYSGAVDITGDGIEEYLFGLTIGASAGNTLKIYKWNHNSLNMIAEVSFHMMELVSDDKGTGIAVWQRYIADTYFVDVLKWNGKQLVFNERLFSKYYPAIEKFYKDKISKMNPWFYWYTLADAQIKANFFSKAEISINKGITLAKQSSLDDAIENFDQLAVKLEQKKKAAN